MFVGIITPHADDIVLLAPTAHAMRCMLSTCEAYAADFSVSFNASKSKCVVCVSRQKSKELDFVHDVKFTINAVSYTHLTLPTIYSV